MTTAITVLLWISGALLLASAALAVIRMAVGPSALDRVVASDVLVSITITVVAIHAVVTRQALGLPIMIVLTMLGFTGPVAMARLLARAERNRRRFEATTANRPTEES